MRKPRPKGIKIGPPAVMRIITEEERPEVVWGRSGKTSVYLDMLQQLVKAGPGSVIEVESLGARNSIAHQAKKHGIKILFGEHLGNLYVKLAGLGTAEVFLLDFLATGLKTIDEINAALAKAGYTDVSAKQLLAQLSEHGKARLIDSGGAKKWKAV